MSTDTIGRPGGGAADGLRAATIGHPVRTFVITAAAMFMAQLDNLVVSIALPSIRESLHAGLSGLQWTVSAYTLTFAVFLLTGSALGDRFGRRNLFVAGLAVFTAASVASALAPNIAVLIAARTVQGLGGAVIVPLSLTLLSASVRPEKRGAAVGAWGAIGGLAVALGPVIGGAVVEAASWQWIFWVNVPLGIVLLPLAWWGLTESRGPVRRLDIPGTVLATGGLLGVVLGLIRGGDAGWTTPLVLTGFVAGAVLLAAFVVWELRTDAPMVPMHLFRGRSFPLVNLSALLMSFGMFGAVFFLSQVFQTVFGDSPLASGIRVLPWTGMPMLVAPIAGILSDRIGGKWIVTAGLGLQAVALGWIASAISASVSYTALLPAFVIGGTGMAMFFAPIANLVLGSVSREQEGIASGVNNALREFGGVLGIAVMGAVFSANGGYGPTATRTAPQHFIDGLIPAVFTGAAVLVVATLAMWLVPGRRPAVAAAQAGDDADAQQEQDVEGPRHEEIGASA
ncbi:drug resistance transporter, EmrB/QacA subfamily [Catenulispora acidiphila DSM 44928]|uniref:Drug resistance transporter, EmrB/QacA subfamily n=1 Tax=Catenulispora acidiphila (strain DSM 44928 / JCM 14897 / NBRC 102108 / NRRL B-24433 / ID139908) TaxID=479433 RepID=C7Q2J6_CATAD|nr:MFS transporter [Catenulispora acidiphila]ACU69838.1 drug resistance transporter, EmrB/QacA subfamily [Catenulispora acidiphila DSM 44928]